MMVMVPGQGERKLKLTMTVLLVRNYSVQQLQSASLPMAGPKAPSMWLHDRKWGQGSSRTGLPCRTELTISHWLKLFHRPAPQQCDEHPHQEMASYGPALGRDIGYLSAKFDHYTFSRSRDMVSTKT